MAHNPAYEQDDPADDPILIPLERAKVGEKWMSGATGHVYEIQSLHENHVLGKRESDGQPGITIRYGARGANYFKRVAEAPSPHAFTDPYCAARNTDGDVVRLCVACGIAPTVSQQLCVPRDWRTDLESYVAKQMAGKDAARVVPARPVWRFAQSHSLLSGGVFSLRDEVALSRRR